MESALHELETEEMGYKKASTQFGIPKSKILFDNLNLCLRVGPQTKLHFSLSLGHHSDEDWTTTAVEKARCYL